VRFSVLLGVLLLGGCTFGSDRTDTTTSAAPVSPVVVPVTAAV
jgi:hypothetical protein